jgi:catechol 2,3-dioxygenase-like lactoylglutathione lyase family enzyme
MSGEPQAVAKPPGKFTIFRAAAAPSITEVDVMSYGGVMTPELGNAFAQIVEAGFEEGQTVKLLFSVPGFSLTYAWFKSGFPLPRHKHDAGCLYYIIAGSLSLGTETLGAGDGFFVPPDVPYTYKPGPQGVEVLEFRQAERFNIEFLADNPAFWARALETVRGQRDSWKDQPRPQDLAAAR